MKWDDMVEFSDTSTISRKQYKMQLYDLNRPHCKSKVFVFWFVFFFLSRMGS